MLLDFQTSTNSHTIHPMHIVHISADQRMPDGRHAAVIYCTDGTTHKTGVPYEYVVEKWKRALRFWLPSQPTES